MIKDTLFLLAPGFESNNRRQYCPECAEIWGVLAYFPAIRESLEIHYLAIDKPRNALVKLLGEANQNCPTLVLGSASPIYQDCGITDHQGLSFIDNARDIGRYYAARFGTPVPSGD